MRTLQFFITYEGRNFSHLATNPSAQMGIVDLSGRLFSFTDDVLNSQTGIIDIKSNGSIEISNFPTNLQEDMIEFLRTR